MPSLLARADMVMVASSLISPAIYSRTSSMSDVAPLIKVRDSSPPGDSYGITTNTQKWLSERSPNR